ncbi:unnamed protein product, partial [Heterosigma akashiwo]
LLSNTTTPRQAAQGPLRWRLISTSFLILGIFLGITYMSAPKHTEVSIYQTTMGTDQRMAKLDDKTHVS